VVAEDPTDVGVLPDEDRTKTIRHNDGFELVAGTMLGDYQIERAIGEGATGIVYAAVHPVIGKRVAVKVLKKELCNDADAIERFVDEARAVNLIGHPNTVDVFAFGEVSGRCYLVMEWLQGESLRDRAKRARLTLREVCTLLSPLARALAAAHEKNVIHRDFKPDNVFLVGEGHVKLLDFGLAKLGHGDPGVLRTAVGAMLGTPQYIAPEQAKGHAIDHRVDIYAFGVVAFELLAGRPPFVADNAIEMVAKHLMEPPPRLASLVVVPRALDELVAAMLAKDPSMRPSMERVCTALDHVATDAPDRVPADVIVPRPAGARWSLRTIALGCGVLACGALATAIVASTGSNHPFPSSPESIETTTDPMVPAATVPAARPPHDETATQPQPTAPTTTTAPAAPTLPTEPTATNATTAPVVDPASDERVTAVMPPRELTRRPGKRKVSTDRRPPPKVKRERVPPEAPKPEAPKPEAPEAPKPEAPKREPLERLPDGLVAPGSFGGRP
jgi:serine/threonine-protein kinase